ncbi:cardiolipin synthase (CMP-forming) [Myxococcaceae bacterium]|jgi:phosphatidylglycerophosphate synthase|nr:cardiolipin synthase (CMP-forming) [Myxococcaceae bacterium]
MIAATPEQPREPREENPPRAPRSARLATAANALTLVRLAAAPVAALAIFGENHEAALLLFTVAVATDLADGPLARRSGGSSPIGGFLDHATDATFVSLGLFACALRDLVPFVLPLFVMAAFVQYTLDSRALSGRPLRASALGRWNGVAYFVLLGVPVVRDGLSVGWPADGIVLGLGWALVVSTGFSMILRGRAWLDTRPRRP